MKPAFGERIECLDGLRGIAALWVLIGHAHILTNFKVPIIGDPDLGVDLFILLSGFLMVYQYKLRAMKEPWEAPSTWQKFWTRRFFRIAPLYYLLLAIALFLGPVIFEARTVIDTFNGVPPQPPGRYLDQSLWNWLAHLTFIFGALPDYAYKTALPDWSIGLEMQFYLFFPLLMIAVQRAGVFKGLAIIVIFGVAVAMIIAKFGVHFPMPSFLPLKLHVFAAGMLLASVLGDERKRIWLALAGAVVLILIPIGGSTRLLHEAARVGIVLGFFALVFHSRLPIGLSGLTKKVSQAMGAPFVRYMGEFSFGAYLWHLMIMQPLIALLINHFPMGDVARWAVTLIICIPITYALAALGYYLVERPGQAMGRLATSRPSAQQ
ncbi:acyltransferase [Agrobacterium sp.]|uniref:acyltransferase family protein n=1 Tax=Agrobacterium sp. TaxID=361 RepID=UPI0028AA3283